MRADCRRASHHVQRRGRQRVRHGAHRPRVPRPAALRRRAAARCRERATSCALAAGVRCRGCAARSARGALCRSARVTRARRRDRRSARRGRPWRYAGVARDLVAALKFRRARPVADVMAAHIVAGAPPSMLAGATIVAVPAHPAHASDARLRPGAAARAARSPAARARRWPRPLRPARTGARASSARRAPSGSSGGRIDVVARRPARRRACCSSTTCTRRARRSTRAPAPCAQRGPRSVARGDLGARPGARISVDSGGSALTPCERRRRTIHVKGSNA